MPALMTNATFFVKKKNVQRPPKSIQLLEELDIYVYVYVYIYIYIYIVS
jgi:hypothetical protein